MRRTIGLMALLALAAACSSGGAPGTLSPTTAPPTSTLPPTTSAATSAPTTHVNTTTTSLPETVPVGGTASLAVVVADSAAFSFSPWSEGYLPAIGEAYLAGAWEMDPATLDLVPDLVVEMPTTDNGDVVVQPDGSMSVTYRIRPEAVWEDGRAVTGGDFAFTYEAVTGLDLPDPEAALYAEIDPESVVATEKTITFTLPRATMEYERLFAVVLPRHALTDDDPAADWAERPWPSAGPFRFLGWDESAGPPAQPGSVAVFERNPAYWRTDAAGRALPYLDTVTFRLVTDARGAVEAFALHQLDAVDLGPWPDVISRLRRLSGVTLATGNGSAWEQISFQFGVNNRNQDSLNQSTSFRRAVAHALDRASLTGLASWVNGGTLRSFLDLSPIPGGQGWDRYGYDPALAAALLEDACSAAGRDCAADPPVVVISTTAEGTLRPRLAEMVAEMLTAIGCEARLAVEDSALFFGRTFARGDWDLGIWAWEMPGGASGVGRMLATWDPAGAPPLGMNYQRWATDEVTGYGEDLDQAASPVAGPAPAAYGALLAELATTVERDRYFELAADAEEVLADQVVLIPLATRGRALAWWEASLAGLRLHPYRPGTWNLESWYRPEA